MLFAGNCRITVFVWTGKITLEWSSNLFFPKIYLPKWFILVCYGHIQRFCLLIIHECRLNFRTFFIPKSCVLKCKAMPLFLNKMLISREFSVTCTHNTPLFSLHLHFSKQHADYNNDGSLIQAYGVVRCTVVSPFWKLAAEANTIGISITIPIIPPHWNKYTEPNNTSAGCSIFAVE